MQLTERDERILRGLQSSIDLDTRSGGWLASSSVYGFEISGFGITIEGALIALANNVEQRHRQEISRLARQVREIEESMDPTGCNTTAG